MDGNEKDASGYADIPVRDASYPDSTSDLSDGVWISWESHMKRRFKTALLYGALSGSYKT